MATDRLQTQRFELKYVVSAETARTARQYISCYLKPDDYAATLPDHSYPVHSLYLDSPELTTYQAVQTGEKNRFKLRIRYYSDHDEAVQFEIKRRANDVILKQRATVRRDAVRPLLAGEPPQLRHLARPDGRHLAALQEFGRLMRALEATPRSHVAYRREAWMSPANNSMRVTFDRDVRCEPEFGFSLRTQLGECVAPFGNQVVLELKFVDRLPNWCREMIQALGLKRGGAPKYAQGVLLLGEHRISNDGVGFKLPRAERKAAAPRLAARSVTAY
ncbi:MAG: polyphosphate polymerase domain-containing protein [Opitutaceae bacterium]|nr:polyphosphate polymerase domain-containing protein [Opitutaceae bacterium]